MKKKNKRSKRNNHDSLWASNLLVSEPDDFEEEFEEFEDSFLSLVGNISMESALTQMMETYCTIFEVLKEDFKISDDEFQRIYDKSMYLINNDPRFLDIYDDEEIDTFDYYTDYLKNNFKVDIDKEQEETKEEEDTNETKSEIL